MTKLPARTTCSLPAKPQATLTAAYNACTVERPFDSSNFQVIRTDDGRWTYVAI